MMELYGPFRAGKAGRGRVAPCRTLPPVCRCERRPRLRPADTNRARPARKNAPMPASDVRHLECRTPGCWRDCHACRGPGDGLLLQARGAATGAVSTEGLFSSEILPSLRAPLFFHLLGCQERPLRPNAWNSVGVGPTRRRKVLVKWLWLAKPVDKLISTRLAPVERSISLARSTRRSSTYRCGA